MTEKQGEKKKMVNIKKVDANNIHALLKLEIFENQKTFVPSNTESIVEAYAALASGGTAIPFGIYNDDTPIGFLMIGYDDIPGEHNPEVSKGNYGILSLMIDKNYQGKGYSKEVMKLAIDYIKSFPCGKADSCYLTYEPTNVHAAKLYSSFGFAPNGEYDEGEIVAVLKL